MMRKIKWFWGLLILASAVALVFLLSARVDSERSEKQVALYMPVEEVSLLAEASGEAEATWLERFHSWGLTAVAVEEESLSSLVEKEKGIAYDLVGIGMVLVELGQATDAVAPLERALAPVRDEKPQPFRQAQPGRCAAAARALGQHGKHRALVRVFALCLALVAGPADACRLKSSTWIPCSCAIKSTKARSGKWSVFAARSFSTGQGASLPEATRELSRKD